MGSKVNYFIVLFFSFAYYLHFYLWLLRNRHHYQLLHPIPRHVRQKRSEKVLYPKKLSIPPTWQEKSLLFIFFITREVAMCYFQQRSQPLNFFSRRQFLNDAYYVKGTEEENITKIEEQKSYGTRKSNRMLDLLINGNLKMKKVTKKRKQSLIILSNLTFKIG